MSRLARQWTPQKARAQVASLPAPVGGWNARDALANMAPTDAVTLTNMFPTVSSCDLRGGYISQATGMSGDIQTLMVYNGAATSKMFAVDATALAIYDVTSVGAVGAAVVSGLTNAKWQYTNVTTAGGNYLYCCNGADKPRLYDGTNWTAIDSGSTPAITGVTTTNLINTLLFKNRVWFIEKNTLKAWYLPTQAVGGAAQSLDMSSVAQSGGYLVDMVDWSIDAGYGLDDMLAFITNKGEVIVYRGTDPASAATWTLVGVWQIGAPIGNRCMFKWAGDSLIVGYDGLLPMAQALQSSRLDPQVALTDKIQGAISAATSTYGSTFGWEIFYYAKANALWINIPVGPGQQQQYVMNTITKNWCNFTGWSANCWALFNDEPYFGGTGAVYKAWDVGYSDLGANINTNAVQAFNYFDQRGITKYFTRARANIITTGQPTVQVGMAVDYAVSETVTPVPYSASSYGVWDSGTWDSAIWGQSLNQTANWQGITGIGYCGAPLFQSASKGVQIKWASTDVVYQDGWAGI